MQNIFAPDLFQSRRNTSIILKIDAPLPAADVRKPDRSECPEYVPASNPARAAYALTKLATERQERREARTVPALSIGRKIGPASIAAASNHARSALTGQATPPPGIAMLRPSAS